MYLENIVPGMKVVTSLLELFSELQGDFFSLSQINGVLIKGTRCSVFVYWWKDSHRLL